MRFASVQSDHSDQCVSDQSDQSDEHVLFCILTAGRTCGRPAVNVQVQSDQSEVYPLSGVSQTAPVYRAVDFLWDAYTHAHTIHTYIDSYMYANKQSNTPTYYAARTGILWRRRGTFLALWTTRRYCSWRIVRARRRYGCPTPSPCARSRRHCDAPDACV